MSIEERITRGVRKVQPLIDERKFGFAAREGNGFEVAMQDLKLALGCALEWTMQSDVRALANTDSVAITADMNGDIARAGGVSRGHGLLSIAKKRSCVSAMPQDVGR